MQTLLRRPLLSVPSLGPSARAFSVSSARSNSIYARMTRQIMDYQKMERDSTDDRAFCGGYPANPPPTRLTYNSPELTFSGHKTNALGDPIGFETTALGMDPEEAYWFGVQGVQEYAEHHEAHERGWHKEMDGFIRGDETGPHYCFETGRHYEEFTNAETGRVQKSYIDEWEAPAGSWFEYKSTKLGSMMAEDGRLPPGAPDDVWKPFKIGPYHAPAGRH